MKTRIINILRICTFGLSIVSVQCAHAFYQPTAGRWLSRDPSQESGGANLYAFCGNDNANRYDALGQQPVGAGPWGPPVLGTAPCPYADPCAAAKRQGMDKGNNGGVVCCGGVAYACVWNLTGFPTSSGGQKAKQIIAQCILAHENTHVHQKGPCGCGFYRRSTWTPHQDECEGYYAEMRCLRDSISQCGGDPACTTSVNAQLNDTAQRVISECAAANQ